MNGSGLSLSVLPRDIFRTTQPVAGDAAFVQLLQR
jgi:hypothetical protein